MIPRESVELIFRHEGCPEHPYWPGGHSGITLGVGYDLAHHSEQDLRRDWLEEGRIQAVGPSEVSGLLSACGKAGNAARDALPRVRRAVVSREWAMEVFLDVSLPKYEQITEEAFPGVENLPELARGALVSLIYNRGGSMGREATPSWESRKEMREVRDAVADGDLPEIAAAIRRMKRLWEGKGLDGLLRRREDEAKMVEES